MIHISKQEKHGIDYNYTKVTLPSGSSECKFMRVQSLLLHQSRASTRNSRAGLFSFLNLDARIKDTSFLYETCQVFCVCVFFVFRFDKRDFWFQYIA